MPRRIPSSTVSTVREPPARTKSPADTFRASASGQSWFVKAEMQRQLGGLRRGPGGSVAKRAPMLEVTVKRGGKAEAAQLLSRLGLEGRVVEERPVRHGWRR